MKAEETRLRLIKELEAQFSGTSIDSNVQIAPGDPVITFPTPSFEKPNLFIPQDSGILEINIGAEITAIKGIGFKKDENNVINKYEDNQEIYNMRELISTNPENMKTFSYDEKVMKTQLSLVKRKEWQDTLFGDVDWFKQINITDVIKRFFKRI